MRRFSAPFAALVIALPAFAQEPVTADTSGRDTTRVTRLPELEVTVTRTAEPLTRVPFAVGVLDRDDLQRARQTIGIDEALNDIPGVVVANRYNFSLDQRISIRGFGSRSNFGVRGLKILLDGIPQTLPDGQSQLTNIDFADLERAEVLRGASSSLYGNASGGVIAFQSQRAAPAPFAQRIRVQGGSGEREGDGFYKWQSWSSARSGNLSGTLSVSQFKADGFRQHSAAEVRQLNAGADYAIGGSTLGTVRVSLADSPEAQNPGALTLAEYLANPDSAAGNNILRGADKDVQQYQVSLGAEHFDAAGNEYEFSVFGLARNLENPLAAPAPGGGPTNGTYVDIGRLVGGARASTSRRFGEAEGSPQLSTGADLQLMRDNRRNFVHDAGAPTGPVLLDQREKVTELGPFAQLLWSPNERLLLSGGARFDWVRFDLRDRFLDDGDDSDARTMSALSGNVGASWSFGDRFVPYVNVSTAFETPTTTELVNQPDGSGGFNTELGPQRAVNYEVGARGQPLPSVTYTVAVFLGRISDAIVQQEEVGGRAFFRNAGRTHNDGAEIGVTFTPVPEVALTGAYTRARYRFTGGELDGNRLPGVPEHFWRLGVRSTLPRGFFLDGDHTLSSSVAADDANAVVVDSWGAGVTNLRLGWQGEAGSLALGPFLGLNNLWDRRYVASVTLNGLGGRVIEPAPRRVLYLGAEIGYATDR
ncbi:MAG: TonB-dependent receptor [Gemmatimonadales bacterium]|nr:TonB-dependent receptor [Gemmatimonadales bacterium]MBA3555598.1 TonB-dependent receptor [Gemmatimonadales bacterium]